MRFETFSRQQRRVLTWWLAPETSGLEAVICDGAVRSGKTLCMGLSFFLWAMGCFDGAVFGLCGKTATALRRNLLDEVLPALGELGFQWEERVSRGRLRVRFGGRENTFYIFGGKDEGSAALIQGATLAGDPGRSAAGRGSPHAPLLCGAGLRPVLGAGKPAVVLLQPGEPGALVL